MTAPPPPAALTAGPLVFEVGGCFAEAVGVHGLAREAFGLRLAATRPVLARLARQRAEGTLPLLTLPTRGDDLPGIATAAQRYVGLADVIVLGTGGSSLGGRTLAALADGGLASAAHPRGRPRLWFVENVDPDGVARVLESVDLARIGLVVVSKSGGTAETLAQAHLLLPLLRQRVGIDGLAERVTVVTEPRDNPLRRLAGRLRLPIVDHDPALGGRFSVLSVTGLLPASLAGVDVAALREGAASALSAELADDPVRSPAAVGAAINVALAETRGVTQTVILPYLDRLAAFGLWFCQLWAESLGKSGKGTTPIRALGAVDQHSQLQLYLAGPADKLFTVVMGEAAGRGPRFATDQLGDPALDWLAGRTMGDLLDVSQRATATTLMKNGRPVRIVRVGRLDARVMGALLMHFMIETIVAAHLLGVDPFDQPAVEQGKTLARQYLRDMG